MIKPVYYPYEFDFQSKKEKEFNKKVFDDVSKNILNPLIEDISNILNIEKSNIFLCSQNYNKFNLKIEDSYNKIHFIIKYSKKKWKIPKDTYTGTWELHYKDICDDKIYYFDKGWNNKLRYNNPIDLNLFKFEETLENLIEKYENLINKLNNEYKSVLLQKSIILLKN